MLTSNFLLIRASDGLFDFVVNDSRITFENQSGICVFINFVIVGLKRTGVRLVFLFQYS